MIYYSHFFLILIIMNGCATAAIPNVSKMNIRPGEARFIEFKASQENLKFFCRGVEQKIHKQGDVYHAVVMESYFSKKEGFSCKLAASNKVMSVLEFSVEDKKFDSEQLRVSPRKIKLNKKDQERAMKEQLMLNKIYASSVDRLLFEKSFEKPLDSFVTSSYGTKRIYNKKKKGQHLGTDFRAPIGVKIPTTNKGKVVFAGDLFYTGHTVIIDHGLDIFSVYGHLSKTLVKSGQIVKKGEIIGLSGNSGRTSGPHLHWGVKVQGQYVDGMELVKESKKVFND